MSGSFHHFAPHPDASAAGLPERAVLCVQPVSDNRDFLRQALGGFRVVFAASGLDALRLRNEGTFDAYIVDYWLPDWAGVSLCRDIRKTDPHVPIIVYTAACSDYAPRAFRAGATAYLNAPTDAAALRARLRTLIQASDIHDLRARNATERVIQEELERRAVVARERTEAAMRQAEGAIERAARVKASKAFLAAGGTLGGFGRSWPQQFAAAHNRSAVAQPSSQTPHSGVEEA